MKGLTLLSLLAWLASSGFASAENPSPVTRVAQLLRNLASKIDSELDAETKLYEDYVCWAKTVISSKTESNAAAQSRVDSLKTYLADLDAGRIELTSERSDLTKEVNELNNNLETAKALREKEHADYEAATKEMKQGIAALEEAIEVLDEATKESKSAFLVSLRSKVSQKEDQSLGFAARVAEADALERAVDVGSRWLKAGDALFLRKLLSGEVPQKDWKKLNRKAEFKMKYKARSAKIQGTLSKLLQQFKDQLEEAEKKEKESQETYDKLKASKEAQLDTTKDALNNMLAEGGAQAVSKDDAKAEIESLETQIEDDKKYISETEEALKTKKEEFVERKTLRLGEIKAINEAVAVIHSDDARDTFKRSMSNMQVSFLQLRRIRAITSTAAARAGAVLSDVASKSKDSRLSALAVRIAMQSGGKFDKVLTAIDEMIAKLEEENTADETNKAECETNREADTKEAASLSRDMDELTDAIAKLEEEIEEIKKEIKEKQEEIKELEKELKEAKKIRKEEHVTWTQNDADDTEAIKLLEESMEVLKTFYKENFSLMQKKQKVQDPPEVEAGEAPPPPPATWEEPYGGATEEKDGIVGIMEVIKGDVEKDQKEAKAAEDKAQADHEKYVTETEKSIDDLNTAIADLEEKQAEKEADINSKQEEHTTKKSSLGEVVKRLKAAQPGCDFLLVNFDVRKANRGMEIDGLKKAKEILTEKNT